MKEKGKGVFHNKKCEANPVTFSRRPGARTARRAGATLRFGTKKNLIRADRSALPCGADAMDTNREAMRLSRFVFASNASAKATKNDADVIIRRYARPMLFVQKHAVRMFGRPQTARYKLGPNDILSESLKGICTATSASFLQSNQARLSITILATKANEKRKARMLHISCFHTRIYFSQSSDGTGPAVFPGMNARWHAPHWRRGLRVLFPIR